MSLLLASHVQMVVVPEISPNTSQVFLAINGETFPIKVIITWEIPIAPSAIEPLNFVRHNSHSQILQVSIIIQSSPNSISSWCDTCALSANHLIV